MRFRYIALALAAALALSGCAAPQRQQVTPKPAGQQPAPATPKLQWDKPPEMKIDPNKQYTAIMQTSLGDITIELFAKDAPMGVNNFVFLARAGFYDGLIFHRIIKDFMIQGGDPVGNGTGGPGYRVTGEVPPKRSYEPGIVAYANAGHPDTQGSQFFICNGPVCQNLDNQPIYTQFGKVIAGMDVVEKISNVETTLGADRAMSKPVKPPVIKKVIIQEK